MSDLQMVSWNGFLAASSPELLTMKPLNKKTTGNGPSVAPTRSLPPLGSVTAQQIRAGIVRLLHKGFFTMAAGP